MVHAFVHLGNLYLNKRPKDVSPVFFQKCFSFSSSSMIHSKLIFYMTKDMSRGSFFFFVKNQLPTCVSQLLNSLCRLTDLYRYSYAIPSLSWLLLLYSKSHNQCMSSSFYSFISTFFWLFCFSI